MSTGPALLLLMQTIDEQERLIEKLRTRNQHLEQEIVQLTRENRNDEGI